jgi:hypothetical protein
MVPAIHLERECHRKSIHQSVEQELNLTYRFQWIPMRHSSRDTKNAVVNVDLKVTEEIWARDTKVEFSTLEMAVKILGVSEVT